ncbi:MAG: hypothetical protein ACRDPY_30380 [Streptosporangiaceae bacterium]
MIFVQTVSFEMSTFMVFTPPGMNGSTTKAGTQQKVTKMSGIIAKATMATRCHEGSEDKIAIPGFTASNRPFPIDQRVHLASQMVRMVRHSRNACCAAATPVAPEVATPNRPWAVQAIGDDERQSTHGR